MSRACVACGASFEAQRDSARYCSAKCRKRGSRGGLTGVVVEPPAPRVVTGAMVEATRARLVEAGVLDTMEGQAALLIAERMESGNDTGSGIAALNRELAATVDRALSQRAAAADPMDELRARRERRNAS